jgi:hypothetical protein
MIIDAHVHCGLQDKYPPQAFGDYMLQIGKSGINGVVMFPPVAEIYDRYDPNFVDSAEWQQRRRKANEYLLTIGREDFIVFPYFFIWNDFAVEQLSVQHKGIKWHRHSDEPIYDYDTPRCRTAIDEIRQRKMPIVLEEEFGNTVQFITDIAKGARVIIPHLGFLNGGYDIIKREGLWEISNVYADTALASSYEIDDYISTYGCERIMFGSDFPFGDPQSELSKILKLSIPEEEKELLLSGNILRLMSESNKNG